MISGLRKQPSNNFINLKKHLKAYGFWCFLSFKHISMYKKAIFFFILSFIQLPFFAQPVTGNMSEEESAMYASTKQINQFIRRFNGEEDLRGNRLYPKDKKYRDNSLRKKYIANLIDLENNSLKQKIQEFSTDINSAAKPKYFDFYAGNWFAEVATKFLYNGKEQNVILFFRIEEENTGYKWSFVNAYAAFMEQEFKSQPPSDVKFIHPMSHEIDFMNLQKIFKNKTQIEHYAEKSFSPDYLSLFFYHVKKGTLVYQNVDEVKFHVFQIENWYFEMKYFTRKGENTGWLISNLIRIPEKEKASLIKSIYHEK